MRQGQYTLVEQVVLFALGLSITLGFMVVFNDLSAGVRGDMKDVQTELVAEYLASASVEMVESGAEGRREVSIPGEIASEQYVMRLGEGGVKVQGADNEELAPLYGLSSRITADGAVESDQEAVTVRFVGGDLRLRRAE